jgi:hypothetical protein
LNSDQNLEKEAHMDTNGQTSGFRWLTHRTFMITLAALVVLILVPF